MKRLLLLSFVFVLASIGQDLSKVKKIFIDRMDADLDQYLRVEILKQLKDRIKVVLNEEDADAILTGVSENNRGALHQVTGRYLGLHDTATAAISLLDKERKQILWAAEAGDRSLMTGVVRRGGPRKVADRIVSKLKDHLNGKKP